jgi:hypothetical protein
MIAPMLAQRADQTGHATRPLLLGFVRAHLLMTETELTDMKERLRYFAREEGFALGAVFVERIDRAPAAHHALLDAIAREEARAVVVPTLRHLAVLGPAEAVKDKLERDTGVRVLIPAPPP